MLIGDLPSGLSCAVLAGLLGNLAGKPAAAQLLPDHCLADFFDKLIGGKRLSSKGVRNEVAS